jgi:hypothetical protein
VRGDRAAPGRRRLRCSPAAVGRAAHGRLMHARLVGPGAIRRAGEPRQRGRRVAARSSSARSTSSAARDRWSDAAGAVSASVQAAVSPSPGEAGPVPCTPGRTPIHRGRAVEPAAASPLPPPHHVDPAEVDDSSDVGRLPAPAGTAPPRRIIAQHRNAMPNSWCASAFPDPVPPHARALPAPRSVPPPNRRRAPRASHPRRRGVQPTARSAAATHGRTGSGGSPRAQPQSEEHVRVGQLGEPGEGQVERVTSEIRLRAPGEPARVTAPGSSCPAAAVGGAGVGVGPARRRMADCARWLPPRSDLDRDPSAAPGCRVGAIVAPFPSPLASAASTNRTDTRTRSPARHALHQVANPNAGPDRTAHQRRSAGADRRGSLHEAPESRPVGRRSPADARRSRRPRCRARGWRRRERPAAAPLAPALGSGHAVRATGSPQRIAATSEATPRSASDAPGRGGARGERLRGRAG